MPTTRAEALKTLKSLKPASVFIQCYQKEELPHDLDVYFGPPEELFLDPDAQEAYTKGRLIPILDDGNFDTVTYYDPADKSLIVMDVEEGEVDGKFANWQQYLAYLMVDIAEHTDDDAELKAIAKTVGFKYLSELKTFLQTYHAGENDEEDDEGEEDEQQKRAFIASLPG